MTKVFICLLVLVFFLYTTPLGSQAHEISVDGSLHVIMHIPPDHTPVTYQPVGFTFDILDEEKKFVATNCDCTVILKDSSKILYKKKLKFKKDEPNLDSVVATYEFEKPGIYQVELVGKPIKSNEFSPFRVSYDFRVEKGEPPKNPERQMYFSWLVGGFLLSAAFIICINIYRKVCRK